MHPSTQILYVYYYRLMFFTDWSGTNPMVARANLDGTKLQVRCWPWLP